MKSNDERDAIDEARQRWESGPVADSLRRLPERDNLRTWSEVPVARLYGPTDRPADRFLETIGFPGEFPYTRGAQATGYRAKLWTRRPITGFRRPTPIGVSASFSARGKRVCTSCSTIRRSAATTPTIRSPRARSA